MEHASRTTIQFPRSANLNGLASQLSELITAELGVRVNVPLYTACQMALKEAISTRSGPTSQEIDCNLMLRKLLEDIRGVIEQDTKNQIPRQRWSWRFREIEERLTTILEPVHGKEEAPHE